MFAAQHVPESDIPIWLTDLTLVLAGRPSPLDDRPMGAPDFMTFVDGSQQVLHNLLPATCPVHCLLFPVPGAYYITFGNQPASDPAMAFQSNLTLPHD